MRIRIWQLVVMLSIFILGIGGYVAVFVPFNNIHSYFLPEYLIRMSWGLFIAQWIPIQWMIVYCCLGNKKENAPLQPNSTTFITIIILTALFASSVFFFNPQNERSLFRIRYLSNYVQKLHAQSSAYAAENNYEAAAESLERYLNLIKNDRTTERQYQQFLERTQNLPQSPDNFLESFSGDANTAAGFVQRAENFFAEEDYISAYYYASLADRLVIPPSQEIRNLMLRSLSRLGSVSHLEVTQRSKYFRELAGARALEEGRLTPSQNIIAYFIFYDLNREYPQDQEILQYFLRSEEQFRKKAFFSEESARKNINPGVESVVFLNRREGPVQEFISIDHLNFSESGSYAYGIEVLRLENTTPVTHFRAEYGKIIGDSLVFRAITPQRLSLPLEYFLGRETKDDYEIRYGGGNIIAQSTPREWKKSSQIIDIWRYAESAPMQTQFDLWLTILQKFLNIALLLTGSLAVIQVFLHAPSHNSLQQVLYYPLWGPALFLGYGLIYTGISLLAYLALHLMGFTATVGILSLLTVSSLIVFITLIQSTLHKR